MTTKEFLDSMKFKGKIDDKKHKKLLKDETDKKDAKVKAKKTNLSKAELQSIVDTLTGGGK
jgi:hypothetical protein